jgi:hypothetical protein
MPISINDMPSQIMVEDYTSINNAYNTPMRNYNSNDTAIDGFNNTSHTEYIYKNKINSYQSPPKQYIRGLNKHTIEPINVYVPPESYNIETPAKRTTPVSDIIEKDKNMNSTVNKNVYPSTNYAGSIPPMQDAVSNDVPIEMMKINTKEYYRQPVVGQSCIDTLNHVMSCPLCSKYFQCDNKVYHVVIIMLILLFSIVMFFCWRDDKRK